MFSVPKPAAVTAVSQLVGKITRPVLPGSVQATEKIISKNSKDNVKSTYALHKSTPTSASRVTNYWSQKQQVRFAHTDLKSPDFSFYKRNPSLDTSRPQQETAEQRKLFSYMLVGSGAVAGTYLAKCFIQDALLIFWPSADVLALGKLEVELGEIPEGQSLLVKWRGKPVFIRHRTSEEAELERSVDLATLRDPQHDADRTMKPDWSIVIGICTHLGCVPTPLAGDYNGFFCPCHGSHYDLSGRIRRGPAPLNLEVPEHSFQSEDLLILG